MSLRVKFNFTMLLAFVVGLAVAAAIFHRLALNQAKNEVLREASIMMSAALAMRSYTAQEITPLLAEQSKLRFLPHTVPSWAAQTTLRKVEKQFPDYTYKEASMNPTNPADRATDWESDIIGEFTRDPDLEEFVSTRDSATGPTLSLSKPIRLEDRACLTCHTRPSAAPSTLIDLYGNANGFGWKLVVTLPLQVAIERAWKTFGLYMGVLGGIFLLMLILLNLMLSAMIVRPVRRMSQIADAISTGDLTAPEIEPKGRDEIASLGTSFNRMRRSLENAMKLLEG
jgi:HAMP domain-containing protein